MPARFFDAENARCGLCARRCRILPGETGFCRVRQNIWGTLYTKTYGRLTACGTDPIEKKPLNHFLPGSTTLSISSFGCNFTCLHCQNHELSQCTDTDTADASPMNIISSAKDTGAQSISFTYNEPTVFYEFMYDTAREAKRAGLKTIMVTNGYLSCEAQKEIAPYMDAVRVDLKAFSDAFYRDVCGGAALQPVLDTIVRTKELGCHLELVTLLIPGLNNSEEELSSMLEWEMETLGPAVPHHFTAFYPMYKMKDVPPAAYSHLDAAFRLAKKEGLYYPYTGNLYHPEGTTTYCPDCGAVLIRRRGYRADASGLINGRCSRCGRKIEGIFE
ncbi:MAG: AmmeMemoRadiSam system radical SAM enzyme [Methanocorpusculum sp.]|nr:AmmeMemoRadiSam system radical SAM enzyme [Methanocorpusculum sp.]